MTHDDFQYRTLGTRLLSTTWNVRRYTGCVRIVSLQFQEFATKANEEANKWKLLQNERYIFQFLSTYLIHLFDTGIVSCTKDIKTVLAYLHQWWQWPQ